MSFEEPTYSFSYPSGQPPTPSRTPTSATFVQSFETPKQESSFYDPRVTWNTADPWAESPDFLKTPKYLTFSTPLKSPTKSSGNKRPLSGQNIQEQIASHVHHLSPNPDQTLPPVEPSRRLSSSPNPSSTLKRPRNRISDTELTPLKTSLDAEATSSMRSAGSMQTPPPTSTTTGRRNTRRVVKIPVTKQEMQPHQTSRRMSSPARGSRGANTQPAVSQLDVSPGFPTLQLSPEVFNFPHSGPATAPVFPQHKLFWDPEQSHDGMSLDFSANDGFPLGLGIDKSLDPFVSSEDQGTPSRLPSASFQALDGSQDDLAIFPVSAKVPARRFSKSRMAASVVNPSMLFSSPGQSSDLPNVASSHIEVNSTLQPYAHQILDAEREIELLGPRKSKRRKGTTEVDSPAVKEALATLRDEETDRPASRRSITDSVLQSFDDTHVKAALRERKAIEAQRRMSASRQKPSRRLSPPKRLPSPSKRTTLTLTIDSKGRASTARKVLDEGAGPLLDSQMDLDGASDGGGSSTSADEMDMAMSQRQSFGFAKKKPNRGKLTRFELDPKSHSQRSSYASTFASSSTVGGAMPTKSRVMSNLSAHYDDPGLLPHPSSDDRASSSTIISDRLDGRDAHTSDTGTIVESDDSKGDAQSELKKIKKQRQQSQSHQSLRLSQMQGRGFEYPNPLSSNQVQAFPYTGRMTPSHTVHEPFNVSPTTVTDPDLATPSSAHGSHISNEDTRCVCRGTESSGGLMIECDSCKKWLHVRCLGLHPERLPEVYLCVFCTGNTPNVRGGRAREPQRALFPTTTISPLAHKSQRFR